MKSLPHCTPNNLLNKLGIQFFLLCLFFLLPTFLVLFKAASNHIAISSLVMQAWSPLKWLSLPHFGKQLARNIKYGYIYLLVGLCTWLYYQGMRYVQALGNPTEKEEQALLRSILKWTLLFSLLLAFVIPFHSWDLYPYINYGAEQAFYGLNPYRFPVTSIEGWRQDVMFHSNWAKYPANYGFTFILLTQFLAFLSGRHFGIAFILFKLFNVCAHVALTFLIYRTCKALPVKKPWLSAYLYGWNPLILFHAIANGHNDLLMALPIVTAFWLLFCVKRFQWLAIPLWVVGILVKYATLPALPFLLLYLIQLGEFQMLAFGLVTGLALAGLLFLPFRDLIGGLPAHKDLAAWYTIQIQYSLQATLGTLYQLLSQIIHPLRAYRETFQKTLGWIVSGVYLSLWANWLYSAFKKPLQPVTLVRITALSTAVLICAVSPIFHAWYIALFFPFVLLLPEDDKLRRFGILLSFIQLLAFTNLEHTNIINLLFTAIPLWIVYGPYPFLFKRKNKLPAPEKA